MPYTLKQLYALWDCLSDVPVSEDEDGALITDGPFLRFELGTPIEDIWHWFEDQNPNFICGEVMSGIRRTE